MVDYFTASVAEELNSGLSETTLASSQDGQSGREVTRNLQPDLKSGALTRFNQSATALSTLLCGQLTKSVLNDIYVYCAVLFFTIFYVYRPVKKSGSNCLKFRK